MLEVAIAAVAMSYSAFASCWDPKFVLSLAFPGVWVPLLMEIQCEFSKQVSSR